MSRLYDNYEPTVIDKQLLNDAVFSLLQKGTVSELAKQDGIHFENVTHLRLDYKNILKIDNLWAFKLLVKLQLDNNIIERIEGIGHLTHLRWLDLSFNNIEKIDGLQNLVNLEDLTLYNNRITTLENMENLKKLQVFSIGNNYITELSNIKYLRQFLHLQSVCLHGNPISKNDDYKLYIHAMLPNLFYLDYQRTDDKLKSTGYEKYQLEIDEIISEEETQLKLNKELAENQAKIELYKQAFIDGIVDENIFQKLFTDDPDGRELLVVPELYNSIEFFSEKFTHQCKLVFELGIKEHDKRNKEIESFRNCIEQAKMVNAELSKKKINEFKLYQDKIFRELLENTDLIKVEDDILDYNEKVQQLWNELMRNESILVEQIDELINEFELNLNDMISTFLENVEEHFTECRELQTQYHERLTDLCPSILERFMRSDFQSEPSDALLAIFIDKESVTNALTASNDAHLLKIDEFADEINEKAKKWIKETITSIYSGEKYDRNRARVMEINHFIDALRNDVENLDIPALGES
ncbi:Dynein regulatory complex subunit 3 [Schistosoma haematobium]|uniref:Dynein regulatory complex subunit 3 n=1 Tax=Schistosoma haematobium TaxID=6185 RepID=A0A922LR20_SCHHA|nr:Dynein regulatory complex subunit 3 [Schistosoma haematobium]KAH9591654.1 Dynein regulatory complex subunit 3 [Schistosoma haematobium]CAH8676673.1 unnamed protein product [Schistosoma haematobium]